MTRLRNIFIVITLCAAIFVTPLASALSIDRGEVPAKFLNDLPAPQGAIIHHCSTKAPATDQFGHERLLSSVVNHSNDTIQAESGKKDSLELKKKTTDKKESKTDRKKSTKKTPPTKNDDLKEKSEESQINQNHLSDSLTKKPQNQKQTAKQKQKAEKKAEKARASSSLNQLPQDSTENRPTPAQPPKQSPKSESGTIEAAWKPVVMEHFLGVRGGYGFGSGRFEPKKEMTSYTGLINFGIIYRFDAPEQIYGGAMKIGVGAIEIDINYQKKGFKFETGFKSGEFYSREYAIIEIPVLWQPYIPFSKKNTYSRFYLSLGPYLGYAVGTGKYKKFKDDGTIISEGDYKYYSARDNRFEYGIALGGGIQVAIKRFFIGMEFRYNLMFSDIEKSKTSYPLNTHFRTPVDQMSVSFTLGYKLTNRGAEKRKNRLPENLQFNK